MARRRHTREFKLEAVRLVSELMSNLVYDRHWFRRPSC